MENTGIFYKIILAFIPIFVAVDAMGLLPIFASLTHGLKHEEKNGILIQSILTASALAISFLFVGKALFRFLGISVGDFMVAGGAILFCIAIVDIMNPIKRSRLSRETLGAVPLGTPLIVGPAVLATSLILIEEYGLSATLIAMLANILLVGIVFVFSDVLIKRLGEAGSRALSKVTSLFLAAIAVMLIRKGIAYLLHL